MLHDVLYCSQFVAFIELWDSSSRIELVPVRTVCIVCDERNRHSQCCAAAVLCYCRGPPSGQQYVPTWTMVLSSFADDMCHAHWCCLHCCFVVELINIINILIVVGAVLRLTCVPGILCYAGTSYRALYSYNSTYHTVGCFTFRSCATSLGSFRRETCYT